MKDTLDLVFTFLKILTLGAAIITGFSTAIYDNATIFPKISASVTASPAQWFYSNGDSSCTIPAFWQLKNNGKELLSVENISYSLYAINDTPAGAEAGNVLDLSLGHLLNKQESIAISRPLFPEGGLLSPGESISRDININYHPDAKVSKEWFTTRKFYFYVEADVEIKEFGRWCFFCEKTGRISESYSKLKYACRIDESKETNK